MVVAEQIMSWKWGWSLGGLGTGKGQCLLGHLQGDSWEKRMARSAAREHLKEENWAAARLWGGLGWGERPVKASVVLWRTSSHSALTLAPSERGEDIWYSAVFKPVHIIIDLTLVSVSYKRKPELYVRFWPFLVPLNAFFTFSCIASEVVHRSGVGKDGEMLSLCCWAQGFNPNVFPPITRSWPWSL